MPFDKELYRAVDYILNRASPKDLDVLKAALERRQRDSRSRLSAGNIRGMAHDLAGAVSEQLESIGDIKEMTKKYIRDMVRRTLPEIPEEQLELMLEEWVPDRRGQVSEENLPRDVARSMVVQFVDYSVGRMTAAHKAELQKDWSRRYWSVFSERTRGLIRELLMGAISEKQFWARLDEERPAT
jgi:hypothetical protein